MVHYQTSRSTRQLFEISLSPRQRTTTVAQNHYNLINATQGSSCKNTCWCKNTCLSVPTSHGRFKCNFLFLQPGNHDHPAPPTIRSSVRVRPKLWKRKHIFTIWMIQYKGPHHHPPHLRSLYPSSFPPFFSAVLSAVTNFDDSLAYWYCEMKWRYVLNLMMMMIVVLMRMSKGMEFRLYSCHQTIQIEFDARNEYKPGFTVETVTHIRTSSQGLKLR